MIDERARRVFVGRDAELSELIALLDRASRRIGSLALIAGDPGIGKSHLLNRLRLHARDRGTAVLVGRCSQEVGAPPYWLWAQALRPLIENCETEVLRRQLGTEGWRIAQAFSDVRLRLGNLRAEQIDESPESARFRLLDAMTSYLRRVTRDRPVLLALDDLQWADAASVRLLSFVLRQIERMPLLIVGSYRDAEIDRDHPLYVLLGDVAGEAGCSRIVLRGWTREDTGRFLSETSRRELPDSLVEEIHIQTGGTPLFVSELGRLLDTGSWTALEGVRLQTIGIPEGIREVIGRRLSQLDPACNRLLVLAAVLGERFSVSVLEEMVADEGQLDLSVLSEAEAAGFIDPAEDQPGRFAFRHALVQRTVLQELSSTERAYHHRQAAATLERLFGRKADRYAAEIARHLIRAGDFADSARLFHYAQAAAQDALSAHAYEEAIEFFEYALGAAKDTDASLETAQLLAGLGRASIATLQLGRHEHLMERAFDICESFGAREDCVRIALSLDHHASVDRLKRRALELMDAFDPDRSTLLSQLALQETFLGCAEAEAMALVGQAVCAVAGSENSERMTQVLLAKARVETNFGRWQRALETSVEAVGSANRAENRQLLFDAYDRLGTLLMQMGRPGRALEASRRAIAIAEETQDLELQIWGLLSHVQHHIDIGELDRARKLSDRHLRLVPEFFNTVGQRVDIEVLGGDVERAEYFLRRFLRIVDSGSQDHAGGVPHWKAVSTLSLAAFLLERDDLLERARHESLKLESDARVGPSVRWLSFPGAARVCSMLSDRVRAERLYATSLTGLGERYGHEHFLGMIAAAAGRRDEATSHFDDAWARSQESKKAPAGVEAGYHYAKHLADANDREHADQVVGVALHQSRRCGMKLWTARLEALQQTTAPATHPTHRPAGLSEREVEVIRLVADGLTDKQIGKRLYISPKTVGNHLTHVREKTACHNRAEIIRFATQNRLLEISQ